MDTRRRLTLPAALVLALTAAAWTSPGTTATALETAPRPNIILITADDMSRTDLRWMPRTRKLLGEAGATMTRFTSNHPMCCPARAEILTGQYGHNNGVHHNTGRSGGYPSLAMPGRHIGAWLEDAGYRTAFVGKHLNGWEKRPSRQPGWTEFNPILRNAYAPRGLTMYHGGHPRRYPTTYTADLIGQLTVDNIESFAPGRAPFFIWASQLAPHDMRVDGEWGPPVPAPRHRDRYPDAMPPSLSSPAFNEADVRDKPRWVRKRDQVSRGEMIATHRARIRSLLAVDDQVGAAVAALRRTGELDNTYVVFTSDNGYLLGEHRAVGKNKPYEPSLQVPLVVRGPGIPAGAVRHGDFSLVDLAPTFLQLGRARPNRRQDGRSMLASWHGDAPGYSHMLIQAGADDGQWWWRGVRSPEFVYVRYVDGFEELYDAVADPHQLQNVASQPEYADVLADHAARLERLTECAGHTCWSD